MAEGLKITYRLYAMSPDKENMKTAAGARFSRATPFYILVYTEGNAPGNSVEITGEDEKRLSAQDQRWLLDCNMVILAEQVKKHEAEIAADMRDRMDRLERLLAQEQNGGEG